MKIGVNKVLITKDLSIQFEKWSDPMKPKAEADFIQHLRLPNWGPLLKYTNASLKHLDLL